MQMLNPVAAEIERVVGADRVSDRVDAHYLHDETEVRIAGRADAIVCPVSTDEVVRVISVKRGQLARRWAPKAVELHARVRRAFDPNGLLNPDKNA